jgi:hypothetical protein
VGKPVRKIPDTYTSIQSRPWPITAHPEGSRTERRAAKKLGVAPASDWTRFAPDENEETA